MGILCTSTKTGTTTTNNTSTTTPAASVTSAGNQALSQAQAAASTPFSTPVQPIADYTSDQTQAANQYRNLQGSTTPYYNNASASLQTASSPVTQNDINSYLNPFSDSALASMKKYVFDPQRVSTMGTSVQRAGGTSAERLALTSQNLDKTQSDALTNAQSSFYSTALDAAQKSKSQALQSAQGWANLGTGYQNAQLQATNALNASGTQQQTQAQNVSDATYNNQIAALNYPFQTASYLSGVTSQLGNTMGNTTTGSGTSTTSSQTNPSALSTIAGLATTAAGVATANPVSTLSGLSSLFGAGSDSGYTVQSFDSAGNPNYGKAASGGRINHRAAGGSVSPFDIGQGYEDGGEAELSPNDAVNDRFSNPFLGSDQYNNKEAMVEAYRNHALNQMRAQPASVPQGPFSGISGGSGFANPGGVPEGASAFDQPQQRPQIYVNPLKGNQQNVPLPQARPQGLGTSQQAEEQPFQYPEQRQAEDSHSMPPSMRPYPDALDRDAGQGISRSTLGMSLMHAGAKMMQSDKSGLGGIGEGIEAGLGSLEKSRKELRSEQEINQKAEALYRQSKAELDKYTKMTPYQRAVSEQGKYLNTGTTTENGHPILFDQKSGSSIDAITGEPVDSKAKLNNKFEQKLNTLESKAKYLVKIGAAVTEAQAVEILQKSIGEPNRRATLIRSWADTILKNDPSMGGDVNKALAKAEEIVGQTLTSGQAGGQGKSADTAIPDPGEGNRVPGTWYINPSTGKPDRWR